MAIFEKRLQHYCKYKSVLLRDIKPGQTSNETMLREAEMIMDKIESSDHLILLDELGKQYTSLKFSKQIEKLQLSGSKRIIFLVAGAFGAAPSLKDRADQMLSLSEMTFSHQMIRVFFLEQLYRAFTIIRNEKYHNN